MTHPTKADLALYAGGDLSIWPRLRVRRHVAFCPSCGALVEALRADREEVARLSDELPGYVEWNRLATEMTANIHLALEAGACVAPRREVPARLLWPTLSLALPTLALLTFLWWLNPSRPAATPPRVASNGITLGGSFTLLNPNAERTHTTYTTEPGTVRARSVDPDARQVTINTVYGD